MANNIFIEFLPPWIETGIQPAFYDKESGTVLQQTARMYAKVNEVVQSVNNQNETIAGYIEKFNQLHDYVYDYFANLDVQQEINNKLDAMVADGSFQPLLNIVFTQYFSILKNYTDEQLDSKVDKDGVGQVTYNNLSQSVKEMFTGGNTPIVGTNSITNENIVDNSISYQKLDTNGQNGVAGFNQRKTLSLSWEQGSRHVNADGSLSPSDNTIVITEPIPFPMGMRLTVQEGYKAAIYSYTSGSRWYLKPGFNTIDTFVGSQFPSAHKEDLFYISIRHDDDSNLTPTEGPDSIIITEPQTNVKPSYFSFDNDTQQLILGKTSTIKLTDSCTIGNALSRIPGFGYANGDPTTGTLMNRAWLNTPIYLPKGATITTTNDWVFVITEASSISQAKKIYYPRQPIGYTDSYTVEHENIYYICYKKSDDSIISDIAHQFTDYLTITLPVIKNDSNTIYVSGNGSDETGTGSYENPYREISTAIDKGASIVICEPGFKYSPFELTRVNNVKIIGNIPTYYTGNRNQTKPFFDVSTALPQGTLDNNVIKIAYIAEENSDMYDCLVAQTKPLKDNTSTRSDGYYCTIFSDGDKDTSHKYIPVLTQDNTAGHFYYDGSYIYINPYNNNSETTQYVLIDTALESNSSLVKLNQCNDITFENFTFKHSSQNLIDIVKCSNIELTNCEFHGSSLNNNVACTNSNIKINECISFLSRNDGFNFHGFGTSTLIKCVACNCFDDGVSHHDQCTHSIIGGEFYGNNKGGISSPICGCSSDIIGAYSHDNYYGILSSSDTSHGESYVNLNGNVCTNNQIGISLRAAKGIAYNNKTINNSTNLVNNSSVVVY